VNYVQVTGAATAGVPTISAQGSDSTVALGLASKGAKEVVVWTNTNNRQFLIAHTASPVNYATVTGSISGAAPVFGVAGSDTNIDLTLTPKGTGITRAQGAALSAENGIIINASTINTNVTIATGYNAHSIGPMTIASGVTVTLSSGQNYIVI
jgi:hypothetical protein